MASTSFDSDGSSHLGKALPEPALKLSFYQRYFTKPVAATHSEHGPSDLPNPPRRRFSFLSIGALLSALLALLVIAGIIIGATVGTLTNNGHRPSRLSQSQSALTDTGKPSPVRLAIQAQFADPSIWLDNGTWYAYGTNGPVTYPNGNSTDLSDAQQTNVQLATSKDFYSWNVVPTNQSPLQTLGAWTDVARARAQHGGSVSTWAPSVIQRADGRFVLYYSSPTGQGNPNFGHPTPHCIGAALSVSDSPAGPYTPANTALVCPITEGGAIDPETIRQPDGSIYIVYKVDGNNIGNGGNCGNTVEPIVPTPIMLQKMQPDALTPDGEPVEILDRTAADGPLVEAPKLVRTAEGVYFLFYSAGCTFVDDYVVRYATAESLEGPYTRADDTLLTSGDWTLSGPGSVGIHEDGHGGWNMAFHARPALGNPRNVRMMYTTKLVLDGHKAILKAQTG